MLGDFGGMQGWKKAETFGAPQFLCRYYLHTSENQRVPYDGWKTMFLLGYSDTAYFQGQTVSFRESNWNHNLDVISLGLFRSSSPTNMSYP